MGALTCVVVPLVDSEVVIARDGDDGRGRHRRVRVGRDVCDGRVGQELHDHAHVVRSLAEHHWRLQYKCTADSDEWRLLAC